MCACPDGMTLQGSQNCSGVGEKNAVLASLSIITNLGNATSIQPQAVMSGNGQNGCTVFILSCIRFM